MGWGNKQERLVYTAIEIRARSEHTEQDETSSTPF